jgi:membrane protein YqaA with SNARE-associated domain
VLELWGLFLACFAAATLLPGGSEVVLVGTYLNFQHPPWLLLLIATLGNTLGAVVTLCIGRFVAQAKPPQPRRQWQARCYHWLRQYGAPVLLLSWLPLVGDGLCLLAGWLKLNWRSTLFFLTLGKALRYLVVLLLATPWLTASS